MSWLPLLLRGMAGLGLLASGLPVKGQFASELLSGRIRAHGLTVAFYDERDQTPVAIIRAQEVYTDYERRAFFRIGVLPVAVAEGVTFELHRPDVLTNGLAKAHKWVSAQTAKRLEFRNVSFVVAGDGTNRLESGRARLVAGEKWELLDGVRFRSGANEVAAVRAALRITGKETGQLVMATDPPWTNNLFITVKSNPETPKDSP